MPAWKDFAEPLPGRAQGGLGTQGIGVSGKTPAQNSKETTIPGPVSSDLYTLLLMAQATPESWGILLCAHLRS